MNFYPLIFLLLSSVFLQPLLADTRMVTQFVSANQSRPEIATLLMKQGKLALEQEPGAILGFYDSKTDVVVGFDHEHKHYYEVDRAMASHLSSQLNSLVSTLSEQMEQAMQGMTEQQKQQFKAMMPGMIQNKPAPGPAKVTIEQTGQQAKVAGVQCRVVQVKVESQADQTICVAPFDTLGLSAEEITSIQKLTDFAGQLAQLGQIGNSAQAGVNTAGYASIVNRLKGFPLQFQSSAGESGQITAIQHDTVNSALFKIPAEYQKQNIMGLFNAGR
ncbi:MAG: hypothetical protein K0U68_16600 [Gammaproteobacteria bacterium]|nr:hypothetical protein [Gammaproteobacteria bacterium]